MDLNQTSRLDTILPLRSIGWRGEGTASGAATNRTDCRGEVRFSHFQIPTLVFCLALVSFILASCATAPPKPSDPANLTAKIRALAPTIDPAEAALTADIAVHYPQELARAYHAVRPAGFNNMLINLGIHPRGLCFQWADDLTIKLMTLHLRTLELHRGVAHLGNVHEHSCVVLTAPGQSFDDGIALDAWRHAGHLAWATVKMDKYPWKEVILDPEYQTDLRTAAQKMEVAK